MGRTGHGPRRVYCLALVICNEADGDADGDTDADGDSDADADGDADGDADEICNGRADDRDGDVDEGDPGAGSPCPTGLAVRCGAGHTACIDGGIVCAPEIAPEPETCGNDGVDDDCNGVLDDIQGVGAACATGLPGICAEGTGICDGEEFGCLLNESPGTEVCPNGLDDDCDGEVDDGAVIGVEECSNPGVDDDCDGTVDNIAGVGAACDTGLAGICATGVGICNGAALDCEERVSPVRERCANLLDDDCDGVTDEGDCESRTTVLLCGGSSRDVATFLPDAPPLDLETGCVPDDTVLALLVTRDNAVDAQERERLEPGVAVAHGVHGRSRPLRRRAAPRALQPAQEAAILTYGIRAGSVGA